MTRIDEELKFWGKKKNFFPEDEISISQGDISQTLKSIKFPGDFVKAQILTHLSKWSLTSHIPNELLMMQLQSARPHFDSCKLKMSFQTLMH